MEACGVEWVLRDEKGTVKWFGAKTYPWFQSALEAEAVALSWAMSCLDNLGNEHVMFESISKALIQAFEDLHSWP